MSTRPSQRSAMFAFRAKADITRTYCCGHGAGAECGKCEPSLVQNKTPAEARQQQGLADKGVEMEVGGTPNDPPTLISSAAVGFQQVNSAHRASNQRERCRCVREVRVWRPATAT